MSKSIFMGGEELTNELREEAKKFSEAKAAETQKIVQESIADAGPKVTLAQLLRTRIAPDEDRVVVWPDPVETKVGEFHKSEETIKREEKEVSMGTVIAVGPGKETDATLTNRLLLHILLNQKVEEIMAHSHLEACRQLTAEVQDSEKIKLTPGDRVIYGRFAGTEVPDPDTKAEVLIMRPGDIFGRIKE